MINKAEFTIDQLMNEVRSLAEQNPDFIYDGGGRCFYTKSIHSEECGCIIGQAILRLQPNLRPYLEYIEKGLIPNVCGLLTSHFEIDYYQNKKKIDWLACVQSSQDKGICWQNAVHTADMLEPTGSTP